MNYTSYTSCEVLRAIEYHQLWTFAYGERILVDITELAKVTSRQHVLVLEELNVLKGRLAIAAILSFTQLAIVVMNFITIRVLYVKKCVEKHRAAVLEADLQGMEARLQERKTKHRTAASRAKGRSFPASPAQE